MFGTTFLPCFKKLRVSLFPECKPKLTTLENVKERETTVKEYILCIHCHEYLKWNFGVSTSWVQMKEHEKSERTSRH